MSKIALDLRQFKHVKSDKNSTTLRHSDGHMLTMAHKALSPEFQKQLQALGASAKNAQTPLEQDDMKHRGMSNGGKVKHYKEGTANVKSVQKDSSDTGQPLSAQSNQQNQRDLAAGSQRGGIPSDSPLATGDWSHIWKANGGEVQHYAEGDTNVQPPQEPGMAEHLGELVGKFGVNPLIEGIKSIGRGVQATGQAAGHFTQGMEKASGVNINPVPDQQQAPVQPNPQIQPPQQSPATPDQQQQAQQAQPPPDAIDQSMSGAEGQITQGYEKQQAAQEKGVEAAAQNKQPLIGIYKPSK